MRPSEPRSFFGSDSTSRVCHSATPMGFFTSRNAYSTLSLFFASLHSSSPMVGASCSVPHLVVHGGEIEIHLARKLRLERLHLQIHHHEAAQPQMVEQQVEREILAAHFERTCRPTNANPAPSSSRNC